MSAHRTLVAFCLALGLSLSAGVAGAERVALDRAVVRFSAPETGGTRTPRFIFERTLAFEARIEALADPDRVTTRDVRPYRERHVRAALERHVAETLLSSLRIDPEPSEQDLSRQTESARRMLYERAGGPIAIEQAARAEGIDSRELTSILRRQARSSLYLDRMVAPMLAPSEAELRNIHRSVQTPFRDRPFEEVEVLLRRWYVGKRLTLALASFFQNARSRVTLTILPPP